MFQLFSKLFGNQKKSALSRSRKARTFTPRLDVLEGRDMPSGYSLSAGTLAVIGDGRADRVVINDNGSEAPGNITLELNGFTSRIGEHIETIDVRTGDGADHAYYNLNGGLIGWPSIQSVRTVSNVRTISFDLGRGDDYFAAQILAGIGSGGDMQLEVSGASGSDTMTVFAGNGYDHPVNVAAGGTLNVSQNGGEGVDHIYDYYAGEMDGVLYMYAAGGDNSDTMGMYITTYAGSKGAMHAGVSGNAGDDTLELDWYNYSPPMSASEVSIADGGGHDALTHTSNVHVL